VDLPPVIRSPAFLDRLNSELDKHAKRDLSWFIRFAWPHFEATPYQHGQHIDVMARRLMAVNQGKVRRLLVNLPRRHTKSDLLSVAWPAWTWLQEEGALAGPWVRFIVASHSYSLAVVLSRKCRQLVESDWYQELSGGRVKIRSDANAVDAWELENGGGRRAFSLDTRQTGFGADVQLVDDPHDIREVESAASRANARMFFTELLPGSINDPRNNARVVVAQRTHVDDISSLCLSGSEPYEHVCLPGLYEPDHPHANGHDWRIEPGAVLWPQRFPTAADYEGLAGTTYARAAQVQQDPQKRGGGLFAGADWQFAREAPKELRAVRYWDRAATAGDQGDPDYTVGVLGGHDRAGRFWIVDVQRGRWSPHQSEQRIRMTATQLDPPGTQVWIEEEPGSAGRSVVDHYQRNVLRGFAVRGHKPTGSKAVRADPFIAAAEAGNVVLVEAPWNRAFLDECDEFTGDDSGHDDQVDAAVGAFTMSARGLVGGPRRFALG
jgi:predicted phage terminase large subunit-like protein